MDSLNLSFDRPSSFVNCLVLVATVAKTITRPPTTPNAYSACRVTCDAAWWYRRVGTAIVPVADVSDGTGSVYVAAGTVRVFNFNNEQDGNAAGITQLASVSVVSTPGGNMAIEWFR